ncbi:TIGR03118 family protein [Massilia sp. Mn16-1_5]|uniref:TIGR03118 family protein n=1 Tax=Massilia sp. Mn16-1_5 TaxID=2079199 RepID=UPI00109E95C6|nr:TIGR03118 family protein [Massilia sp. Mn16-1_5]THC40120.1 TIGR03118 family protein [Massilia sp. Mn16-1_5]
MSIPFKAAAWCRAAMTGAVLAAGIVACGGGGDDDPAPPPVVTPPVATSAYTTSVLVADTAPAAHVDPNLVNAWGIAFNPTGFVWVNNQGSSTSTLYDGTGVPQTLVVAIPAGSAGPAKPTGIVFNASTDFKVTQNGVTGASPFIFVGEAGTVSGWSPTVNRTNAVTVVDTGGASSYKGLAIASANGANFIYATDFRNSRIDVYDANFQKVTLPGGGFTDPNLPSGYAPFGIQAAGNRIYVAYAQRNAAGTEEVKGAGLGLIDAYDTSGAFVARIATGGALNAPWGMAIAPAAFGDFSNSLLVANFGDGKINAYNPTTGALMGTLSRADKSPIVIDGLWGIAFGNGVQQQPTTSLFYTAGPANETHGQYGKIELQ